MPNHIAPPVRDAVSSPGPGSPLSAGVAGPLARGFGVDVSPVRVHTDARASTAADALGVRAFTWGTDVFLGSGQRSNDLGLLAHEVSHSIQQGGGPAVQLFDGPHGHLETEAHQASAAIVRGEPVTVTGRTGSTAVQREERPWYSRAVGAVTSLGAEAVGAALNFVKERAHAIPGYDLLGFILGRDPVTQSPVARTAASLIRGVLGFVPGGTALFDNLQQAGVVQRAYEWFTAEIDKLGLTWDYLRGLFQRAWDALSPTDLISPSSAWDKLRAVFSAPLSRIRDFAMAAGKKVMEFVFEGALALAGGAGQQVLAIFRRIGGAFSLIVADPVRFLGNLLRAVMGGFRQFGGNILAHLRTGIFEWLVGALRGVVRPPAKWDFAGIVGVIMQVLGLTYDALRKVLVRLIGDPAVRYVEGAFDFLRTVMTQGLSAAWEKIKEFAGGLADTVIQGIRDWVTRSVVGAAITKLVTMFNPVGAIIQAVITTYNTVMFFVERAQQIGRLLGSIVDSVESIARGNIAAASNVVERTMANALPVILGFLARFAGLGNLAEPVRTVIQRIRATITNAIERVGAWIADRAKGLLGSRQGAPANSGQNELLPERRFAADDESHRLFFRREGPGRVELHIASREQTLREFLNAAEQSPNIPETQKREIPTARSIIVRMDYMAGDIDSGRLSAARLIEARERLAADEIYLGDLLKRLLRRVKLNKFNEKYRIEGLVATWNSAPRQEKELTPDHQPQAALLTYVAGLPAFARRRVASIASDRAGGGMTINLHDKRHREGRTWFNKATAVLAVARRRIQEVILANPGREDRQRAGVVSVVKDELNLDVARMREVAAYSDSHNVWADITGSSGPPDPADKAQLISRVRAQILAGESQIAAQHVERIADPS